MSRASARSAPSSSATRGSSRFDLGKESGVDMGRKAQVSATSGGIGVTQEVINIAGVTITGGVSIDVSPIRLDISGQPNFEDPSKSAISIAAGAEIPGGVLGVSGGITINTSTGEVTEVAIGGEVAGVGVNVSKSAEGGVGVSVSLQIPFTPIEVSVGFGFPPKKEPAAPTPGTPPAPPPPPAGVPMPAPSSPNLSCSKYFVSWIRKHKLKRDYYNYSDPIKGNTKLYPYENTITYEDRIREVYPAYSNYSDAQMRQEFGTPVFNPSALFNQQFRPIRYYYYQVGNNISFGGVAWHEIYSNTGEPNYATDMTIMRSWHNIVSGGSVVLEKVDLKEVYYARERLGYNSTTNQVIWSDWQYTGEIEYILKCADETPPPPTVTAPFPNPPPRKEMDSCCQEVLRFQRQMYNKLGLARFPGELPATIIQEVPDEGEEPAEPPQVPIPDLVSFMDWIFKRDDERWGQWEVQINVKDADVTTEGDQKKQVKFPNLAESIAEIEGQILSLTTNVDALVAIAAKNLVESGLGRQEAIKGYLASKAIIKYMAFKTAEIDVDMPACFTPGAESIDKLVDESTIHFKGIDYIEKETLRDIFLDLLQAAAVIRAVHWQRIDTKKDTKSQLLGILKGSLDLANSIKNPIKPEGESEQPNPAQNFEDFIDSAESGFTNTTGITDAQNPYGKTPDRRPRIRQIGDNISQAGSDTN